MSMMSLAKPMPAKTQKTATRKMILVLTGMVSHEMGFLFGIGLSPWACGCGGDSAVLVRIALVDLGCVVWIVPRPNAVGLILSIFREVPRMSNAAITPELNSQQVSDTTRRTNYGTWRFQSTWKPLHVVDAEGCWFTDGAGKRYLDFSSQLMCVNLGHKNPRVVEAIARQAQELAYVAPGHATEARARLSLKLLEVLPEGLNKFFFATSGTEANEAAFKIARMVTGRTKIISRYRSYHGSTMGSIAATGDPRRWAMEPAGKIPGVIFAPEVNCYKCPIGHTYPSCDIACADYLE